MIAFGDAKYAQRQRDQDSDPLQGESEPNDTRTVAACDKEDAVRAPICGERPVL